MLAFWAMSVVFSGEKPALGTGDSINGMGENPWLPNNET